MRVLGLNQTAKATILKTILAANTWRAVGADNTPGTAIPCAQITVRNDSGSAIEFGYGTAGAAAPTGEALTVITASGFTFRGLRCSGELFARSTGTPTFYSVAEAVF